MSNGCAYPWACRAWISFTEIVSDSSVVKDRQRLLTAYYAAGVPEYWLAEARGAQSSFQIYVVDAGQYRLANVDDGGFQRSTVLDCDYRLQLERGRRGYWQYCLEANRR